MNDSIYSEMFRALSYIFFAIIVYSSWRLGNNGLEKETSNEDNKIYELHYKDCVIRLGKGILIIFTIAFIASYVLLGNSSDCSEETDPIRGSCNQVVDFKPTQEQRNANLAYYITLLGIPYVLGGINKLSKIKNGEVQKEYEKHMQESARLAKENERAVKRMMATINSKSAKKEKR